MRTLLSIPADTSITKVDLDQFCELGISERSYVDYKKEFPRHLERTIASFANTNGGIVLIGVDADAENKPVCPVAGIEFQIGLEERVFQICASSIYPPLIPTVWLVRFEDPSLIPPDRACIVIRVPESEAAAHAVEGRREIYVRTGNINSPVEKASVDEIRSLFNRRREAAELRESLTARSRERFEFALVRHIEKRKSGLESRLQTALESFLLRAPKIGFRLCPMFPRRVLSSIPSLSGLAARSFCTVHTGESRSQMLPARENARTVQDGVVMLHAEKFLKHTEVTQEGLISFSFYSPNDGQQLNEGKFESSGLLDLREIAIWLLGTLLFARKIYRALGFWGQLEFVFEIDSARGCRMGNWLTGGTGDPCPDRRILHRVTFNAGELQENLAGLFEETMNRCHFAFGDETGGVVYRRMVELSLASGMNQS